MRRNDPAAGQGHNGRLLRCKSAPSHHTFDSQPTVFPADDLFVSVMNPPQEAGALYCVSRLRSLRPVFDNRIFRRTATGAPMSTLPTPP